MDGDKGYDEKAAAFVSTPNQFFDDKAVRRNGGWRDHHGKTPRRKWLLVDFP